MAGLRQQWAEAFGRVAARMRLLSRPATGIPPAVEPRDFNDPLRLERLARSKQADHEKWGTRSSYDPAWAGRGALAARHIQDGDRILEIGAGTGSFRDLVAARCDYTGADLAPLDATVLRLNLETDALPPGPWDKIVILGVIEYLYDPIAALARVSAISQCVILSYCLPVDAHQGAARRARGWPNALSGQDLADVMSRAGLSLRSQEAVNTAADFEQILFVFSR